MLTNRELRFTSTFIIYESFREHNIVYTFANKKNQSNE